MNIHDPAIETQEEVIKPSQAEAEAAVQTLLRWAGDNPSREGLLETPSRVVKAYSQWFRGYREDPQLCFSVLLKKLKAIMRWCY